MTTVEASDREVPLVDGNQKPNRTKHHSESSCLAMVIYISLSNLGRNMSRDEVKIGIRPPSWVDNTPDFDDVTDWVVRAEKLGFDSVHAGDRLLAKVPPIYQSTMYEVITSLTTWANHTSSINLSPLIFVVPYRNPIHTAKIFGTMDVASEGRMILGVGTGWNPHEFEELGIPRKERGQRLEEGVEIVQKLWTEDHVSYTGEIFQLEDATVEPKPVQEPHIPIWFGSFGPQVEEFTPIVHHVLERVGRLGDGWAPLTYSTEAKEMLSSQKLGDAWEIIAQSTRDHGRNAEDLEIIYSHWSYIMEDEDEERDKCMEALGTWFDGTYKEGKNTYLIGTPEDIVEQLVGVTEHLPKVDRFIFTPFVMNDKQQDRLMNDVVPLLRDHFG